MVWKATEDLQDHLDQPHFLEAKEMRGAQELQEALESKDGLETQGLRAGLACLVSQGRKGPRVHKDSWATLDLLELWVTGAPRDPKETRDSQVLLAPWDPQASQESPRGLPSNPGQWDPRAGEAFQAHWER